MDSIANFPKLSKFEDLSTFCNDMERFLFLGKFAKDDDKKVYLWVKFYLADSVLAMWENLTNEEREKIVDVTLFRELVIKHFGQASYQLIRSQMANLKQQDNQSFSDFVYKMVGLSSKLPKKIPTEEIIYIIKDNSLDQIKKKLLNYSGTTIEDLVKHGSIIEHSLTLNENHHLSKITPSTSTVTNNNNNNDNNEAETFIQSRKPNSFKRFPSSNQHFNSNTKSFSNHNFQYYGKGKNFNSNVKCFNCQGFGHIASNCSSPKRNNGGKPTNFLLSTGRSDSILKAEVSLNGIKTLGIIDTASDISIIDYNFVKQLGTSVSKSKSFIRTASGTFQSFGETVLNISLDNHSVIHSFSVASFRYPVLLGMDILSKLEINISLKKCSLHEINILSKQEINCDKNYVDNVFNLLSSYNDSVFGDKLGRTNKAIFSVKTTSEKSIKCNPYTVFSLEGKIAIEKQVKEMLDNGIIEYCNESAFSSPVLLVPKPDGTWRFCIDYSRLNTILVDNNFPLPNIMKLIYDMVKKKIFSTIDLTSAYWQIPLDEETKKILAFVTPDHKFYKPNVLPYGVKTAPAFFQQFMVNLFRPLIDKGIVRVFLDDVVIGSDSQSEHLQHLKEVFDILKEANLTVKIKKCKFFQTELKYLGHIIGNNKITVDPSKIESIKNAVAPKNITELQCFLGMINYYNKFYPNLASFAYPLYQLLKNRQNKKGKKDKNIPFIWTEVEEKAFREIKELLSTYPILTSPDYTKQFYVSTDASDKGLGGVLYQNIFGKEKVIAYCSRTLSSAEKHYSTIEKECLAIVYSLEKFRSYLLGVKFELVTDHKPLVYINSIKDNRRITNWRYKLSEFNFEIKYREGELNANADFLSRNEFIPFEMECFMTIIKDKNEFLNYQSDDPDYEKWKLNLNSFIDEKDGLLYEKHNSRNRLFVPNKLREFILSEFHKIGHLGFNKMYERISQNYVWNGMKNDIKIYVSNCHSCNVSKRSINTTKNYGFLQSIDTTNLSPFEKVGFDIYGPLKKSSMGYEYIIIFTDYATRFIIGSPLKNTKSETIANVLMKEVFQFGIPSEINSDRGENLNSELMNILYKNYGIKKITTTSYHPQANGLTERFNKTMGDMIRTSIGDGNDKKWDQILDSIILVHNSTIHFGMKYSPYYLLFGREYKNSIDTILANDNNYSNSKMSEFSDRVKRNKWALKQASNNLKNYQKRNEQYYNKNRDDFKFNVGDFVYVKNPKQFLSKFDKLYFGPYRILQVFNNGLDYKLDYGKSRKYNIVHISRLKGLQDGSLSFETSTFPYNIKNSRVTKDKKKQIYMPKENIQEKQIIQQVPFIENQDEDEFVYFESNTTDVIIQEEDKTVHNQIAQVQDEIVIQNDQIINEEILDQILVELDEDNNSNSSSQAPQNEPKNNNQSKQELSDHEESDNESDNQTVQEESSSSEDENKEYTVESINGIKIVDRKYQYLVKWEGYSDMEWIHLRNNFENAPKPVNKFLAKIKKKFFTGYTKKKKK